MSMPHIHRHHRHSHQRQETDRTVGQTASQSGAKRERHHSSASGKSHSSVHRHHGKDHSVRGGSSGRTASRVCLIVALLAVTAAAVMELIAYAWREHANPIFNTIAGLLSLAALGAGLYAQIFQLYQWSHHVRTRLRIGLSLVGLTLLLTGTNWYQNHLSAAGVTARSSRQTAELPEPVQPVQEAVSLFKPGWYGEVQSDGVMAVISSFPENAAESLQFNRRTRKPVSYATLSVINMGSPSPVVLRHLRVGLLLDSGEEIQSLAVPPLLRTPGSEESLLGRLAEPQRLATGAMLPDIPICLEEGVSWEHVRGVRLMLEHAVLTVPGRMMTADEKRALIEKTPAQPVPVPSTNLSAEAWFKTL